MCIKLGPHWIVVANASIKPENLADPCQTWDHATGKRKEEGNLEDEGKMQFVRMQLVR